MTWTVERPVLGSRVEWTLAAGELEVRLAAGLPRRVHEELTGLLDTRYGQTGALANRTAILVRALVLAGATGSLRMAGCAGQVLVELVGGEPPDPGLRPDLFSLVGPGESHGYYQTRRHQYVAWGLLVVPAEVVDEALLPLR